MAALFARINLLEQAEDIAEKQGLDIRAAITAAESQAAAAGEPGRCSAAVWACL